GGVIGPARRPPGAPLHVGGEPQRDPGGAVGAGARRAGGGVSGQVRRPAEGARRRRVHRARRRNGPHSGDPPRRRAHHLRHRGRKDEGLIDLKGKRAFVTGGTRGIGLATAELLVRSGVRRALGSRSRRTDADAAVRALGTAAVAIAGDLGVPADARAAVEGAVKTLGALDLLVVNHGVWPPEDVPLAKMTDAQWESTRRANLDSVIYVCRAAIPHLHAG